MSELETRVARLENSTKGAIISTGFQDGSSYGTTLTTTEQDIAQSTFTVSAQVPTLITIMASVQVKNNGNSTGRQIYVFLYIDGTAVNTPYITNYSDTYPSTVFVTSDFQISQSWRKPLTAGSHTIKLRGYASSASGSEMVRNATLMYFQTRA
jgi:hypothetical protein